MSAEDNSKKKPTKRVSKKKTDVINLSAQKPDEFENSLNEKQILQVEDVIKQAFLRFYDTASINQLKYKDLKHLNSIVTEFLSSFMILGYDMNGEKVFLHHAETPLDNDALIEHLRTTLISLLNNGNSGS